MGMKIQLVRHGESEANAGKVSSLEIGDHEVALSERGREQALETGRAIGPDFIANALVYTSPYRRTRETVTNILAGANEHAPHLDLHKEVRVYEDPRLREVEHGYEAVAPQEEMRRRHGWFYYRFRGGESPADCYDRASNFLESMMRQAERKRREHVLIVTHGLLIRCFVMRFLHLSVEDFDNLANPKNGGIVTLADHVTLERCQFSSGRWGVEGLTLREELG